MTESDRILLTFSETPVGWNETIASLFGASILQTVEWAAVKASGGWRALYALWKNDSQKPIGAALILRKKLFLGFEFWYVPRGPLLDWGNDVLRDRILNDLIQTAKKNNAIFIKIDPDLPVGFGVPDTESYHPNPAGQKLLETYRGSGWLFSPQQIQFANSVWIDLEPSEEDLLAAMKQRTRYKVRLAGKKGVTVRKGTAADFDQLALMYSETASRDEFIIRDHAYYLDVWTRFYENGMLTPLIAEVEDQAVAAIMLFTYANRSWYIYGMSASEHREKMPNYLLQWEAICSAKSAGSTVYDLWGAPDEFSENDRMWGVYQFKRGLGGYEVITPGAWDFPLRKTIYRLFVLALPKFLNRLKRRRS